MTGFDGLEPPADTPLVTSMEVPHEDIDASSVARVISRMMHPESPQRTILVEARLVQGQTIAPALGVATPAARGAEGRPRHTRVAGSAIAVAVDSATLCAFGMNLRWHLSHARGYLDLGMIAEAEAELAAISAPDDERPEVQALRVTLLHEKGDWSELRRVAGFLVQRQPEEPGWWVSFAFATRRTLSLEDARQILLAAERAHPEEAIIHFNLGCYACQLGEFAEARRRVWRSIELRDELRELARHDPDLQPLRDEDPQVFVA